jgi:Trehalose utilisation
MPFRRFVVAVVLLAVSVPLAAAEPKNLLLVGQSPDNHPPGTHEYTRGVERLAELLEPTAELKIRVVKADEPWTEGPELIAAADSVVIFLSEGARWTVADPRRHAALAQLAARGGGLVAIHWAMGTRAVEPIEPFRKLFGGCHGGPDRKYQVVQTELRPAEPRHPIAAGIESFPVREEFYYRLKFAPGVTPVMQATIDGQPETVAWAWQRGDGGRSFGFSGLHFHDNWQLPEYQKLLKQAVLWTMKLPIEPKSP